MPNHSFKPSPNGGPRWLRGALVSLVYGIVLSVVLALLALWTMLA